jgi:hypothetical protein
MREITRPQMSSTVALTKIRQVTDLISAANPRNSKVAYRNGQIIAQARYLARVGRTAEAFSWLARATVPAGSVPACCGLRSAQYGCSTHGYPRVSR